jgi:hypothetical protein
VTLTNASTATVHVCSQSGKFSSTAGDVDITVTYTSNGVASDPAHTKVTVQKPTNIVLDTNTLNASGHTCTAGSGGSTCAQSFYSDTVGGSHYTSYVRTRTYHFTDQLSPANTIALNMELKESYNPAGNVVIGGGIGKGVTDCFYFCSQKCRQGQADSFSSTQTILANGYAFTKAVMWTCSDATVQ